VDLGPYIAIGVTAMLVAGANLLFPNRAKRLQRALVAKPRARIDEADGAVRLTGRVHRDDNLLEAPLSGRSCVAYQIAIHTRTYAGSPGSAVSLRLVDLQEARPFLVADESGIARIDTSGPFVLALPYDHSGTASGRYPGKHRTLSLLLESMGLKATNWLGRWRPIAYGEGVLTEGQVVSVGGNSAREIDAGGDSSGPRSPPERLVLRGTEIQPLLIGKPDTNRSG
jgi:hypothetical protein